jgi:hypothetical protein
MATTRADTPKYPSAGAFGQLIDEKSPSEFQDKLDEGVEHDGMMALTCHFEKAVRVSRHLTRNGVQLLPSYVFGRDILC